ncbi:MAG: hypothetical protein K2L73_04830, partial [Muribaculaceae bacterium]|nr:hypothetical protein [Muribaculaceae bacterium]
TIINGKDIWSEFGVFLSEEKCGGRDNLTAIMTPSKVKSHVGVNIREHNGVKYSQKLVVCNEERDVTLNFALFASTREKWLELYGNFISFLKQGDDGWLTVEFPALGLKLRMFYVNSSNYKPLTCLWQGGVHASRFKVTFREPEPIL